MDKANLQEGNRVHWFDVKCLMIESANELFKRSDDHDHTKFAAIGEDVLLRALNTKDFSHWEAHHFSREDHHQEFWVDKYDMPLEALIEMCADGASAVYRSRGRSIPTYEDQYEFFFGHKGWSKEFAHLLANQFMKSYNSLQERFGEKE